MRWQCGVCARRTWPILRTAAAKGCTPEAEMRGKAGTSPGGEPTASGCGRGGRGGRGADSGVLAADAAPAPASREARGVASPPVAGLRAAAAMGPTGGSVGRGGGKGEGEGVAAGGAASAGGPGSSSVAAV